MIDGIFEINSYEMDDVLDSIKKASSDIEITNYDAKETFEPNKQSNVFGNGSKKINSQMDELHDQVHHLGSVMEKGANSIYELEMSLANEIKEIQIPKGYETNDSIKDNQAVSINLFKNDGTSVNEGENSITESTYDDTTRIVKENLVDINNGQIQTQTFDENQLQVNSTVLSDISKDETTIKEFDENAYTDNKQTLYNMNNNNANEVKEIDDINNIEEIRIKEMTNNKNETNEASLNFKSDDITRKELKKIN